MTGTATDQDKCPTKRAIVEHVAKLKRSMGIGGVKGKVKVKGDEDEVQQEEEEDGLGNFGKSGKKEKKKMKMKMKGTVNSSGGPTRLRSKGPQGKGPVSSRFTRDRTDDELDHDPVLDSSESRIKNEDAEYASLPFTAMMADDDTPCPTPRNAKTWGSIPWMFDEDDEEAETERDDCNGAVRLPPSVEEIATKISGPLTTLPLLSSSSSTKEDDTSRSTKRSKTTHQEKSSPGIMTTTATFPKNTSSSSSTPTTYSTMLSPPNPSSSATTTTIQEKEELDKQQNPNSHSNDLFVSPFLETAQAESTATSTGESSSSAKLLEKKKMKEKEKRSYHIVDIDAAHCSRGNKKLKRSNDDDDDDDVGGGSSSSRMGGGRGTRKKRVPLAVLEDYPVGQ